MEHTEEKREVPELAHIIKDGRTLPIFEAKKEYHFFGWEEATVKPIDEAYGMIDDPKMLYDLLSEIWSKKTCAPRLRDGWTTENKTLGQCSITAFLVQDIFGGTVYGMPREGGTFHCYNEVDGHIFDLTSEQFEGEVLSYTDNPEQHREDHFSKYEKKERYLYLKDELNKKLAKVTLLKLVDAAAKGDIQAAETIALGYYDGRFGERNLTKAKKWGSYAAKHGSKAAQELMEKNSLCN